LPGSVGRSPPPTPTSTPPTEHTTLQQSTDNTRLRRRRNPPGPHAREHPRSGYEPPPQRPRSTLDSGLSRRNPVLRHPTRAYQPDRASRTRQDRRPLSRAHPHRRRRPAGPSLTITPPYQPPTSKQAPAAGLRLVAIGIVHSVAGHRTKALAGDLLAFQ
jgi:hypothetical protein